ncbi:MAG: Mrp/NBP35 family ATP-binding protein [Planctomycetota bacterium]
MSLTKDQVTEALRLIRDAETGRNIVENGQVQMVAACDDYIAVTLVAPESRETRTGLQRVIEQAVNKASETTGEPLPKQINVAFVAPTSVGAVDMVNQPKDVPLKQASSTPSVSSGEVRAGDMGEDGMKVRHVVAVGAGKGGVGKSTVSVNLAVALAREGHRVGLLDADIYGPSLPTMLGLADQEVMLEGKMIQPFPVAGLRAMTIGKLVDPEKPLLWRGPMAHGAFKQLTEQTAWGELDYLVIDLPPGTGDVPLSMSQMLTLSGAVVVCTPQRVAQDDAVRAVRMFQQLKIPVLGIVENMSYFIGDDGKEYDIFGRGGAELMAQRLGLPFLGGVPINMKLREHSDNGTPVLNFTDGGEQLSTSLERLSRNIENEVALQAMKMDSEKPTLRVS